MSQILSDSAYITQDTYPGIIVDCPNVVHTDSFIPLTQASYYYPQYDYKYEELRKTILKKLKQAIDEKNCVLAKIYADLFN